MKTKKTLIERLIMVAISLVLLSSFLAFSSIPEAMAESNIEGGQEINALATGQAWVTSYNSAGGYQDIAYVSFGQYYGYRTELSPLIEHVVDTTNNSYVINWRPNVVGDTLMVCGIRIAYEPPGGGAYKYVHIPGAVLLPRTSDVEWGYGSAGCIYLKSGPTYRIFNINLNIPSGSQIDYLRVYYYREAAAQIYLPMIKK